MMQNIKNYLTKHRKFYGLTGAVLAVLIATLYFVIVPEEALRAASIPKAILTYGHGLCWVLLSVAIALWGFNKKLKLASLFAYAALAVYVGFISTLLLVTYLA